jgi:PIN domain nuclease of toxin-antitoxin system
LKLLLDSNVVYWAITNPHKLTSRAHQLIANGLNELYVSSASLWELSIKIAKGKLVVPSGTVRSLYEQIDRLGIVVLPITRVHIIRTETLPHHHGDPFDRMIVAQALEEGMTILTSDTQIPLYSAPVVWK